ncbi:hypothetical protein CSPX01_14810 [Colletotrichum filicis]|nr:hypothetical protein CSPX01_14810 [Colletotrichum filicis]
MPRSLPLRHSEEELAAANTQRLHEPCLSITPPIDDAGTSPFGLDETVGSARVGPRGDAGQEAAFSVQPMAASAQEPCEQCLSSTRPLQDAESVSDTNHDIDSNVDLSPDGVVEHEHKYWSENVGPWRPTWLQPAALLAFGMFFISVAIALPTMYYLSWKNNGLVETREDLVYLWRFGPTAAMLLPKVLYQALKRRHYFVFIVVIISISLKTQIVLAPDLFSINPINATEAINIDILDSFNTNVTINRVTFVGDQVPEDSSPYHMAQAVANFRMEYPFGIAENISYQTFKSWNGSRGTVNSPVEAIVDGYFTETQCLKLKNHSYSDIEPYDSTHDQFLYFAFRLGKPSKTSSSPIMLNLAAVDLSDWKSNSTAAYGQLHRG